MKTKGDLAKPITFPSKLLVVAVVVVSLCVGQKRVLVRTAD